MKRPDLVANDNIFTGQSTFFVKLAETSKIISEATTYSLIIFDELGCGTSSCDDSAVAQASLHRIATHIGCTSIFTAHYQCLAAECSSHQEIRDRGTQIYMHNGNDHIAFLYELEEEVAGGSFGMHCASLCCDPSSIIERAEVLARDWESASKLSKSLKVAQKGCWLPPSLQSDVA